MRPVVLHLTGDFPDSIDSDKTQVIRHLVDLTSDKFEHHVVSINRTTPANLAIVRSIVRPGELTIVSEQFAYGTALAYSAPPKGIRHETRLVQLGRWLADYIACMGRKPALIVGHKLAIEGIAVREAARLTKLPYALSIQGDSDTKIMDFRPDLNGTFRNILSGAGFVFPFSPWSWKGVVEKLGEPSAPNAILPCPTELDNSQSPKVTHNGMISVFHLKNYRRKNFATLAQAMTQLDRDGAPRLDVIGGGGGSELSACNRIARSRDSIRLLGSKSRAEVRIALNAASGFVLPSRRETFGLVFIEALFAGTPIIYPEGTAVDGLFDGAPFALSVPARDPRAIANAIRTVMARESELKAELASWQVSDHAKQFQREHIASTFVDGLKTAIGLNPRTACAPS